MSFSVESTKRTLTFEEGPNKRIKTGEDPPIQPDDDGKNLFEELPFEVVQYIFILLCQTGSYITTTGKKKNNHLKVENVFTTNIRNFQLICKRFSAIANDTFIQFARKEIDLKGVEDTEVAAHAYKICIPHICLLAKSIMQTEKPKQLKNIETDCEIYNLCYLLILNKAVDCEGEKLTCARFNLKFPEALHKIAMGYLKTANFNDLKMQWKSSSILEIKKTLNLFGSKKLDLEDFKKFLKTPLHRQLSEKERWCDQQTVAYCYYELLLNQFYDFVPDMMFSMNAVIEIINQYDQEILFNIPEKCIKSIDWLKAPTCPTEKYAYHNHLVKNSNTGVFNSTTGGFKNFKIDTMFKRICIQNTKSPKFAEFIKSILTIHADKITQLLEPKEEDDITPLHLICFYSGNKEAAEVLLNVYKEKFGEEALQKYINQRAHKNMQYTPIHLAVMHPGNEEILKYLFSLGANPFLETKGMDALHLALLHKRPSYVKMILSHDKFQENKNKSYAGDGINKKNLKLMLPLMIPHNYLDYAVLQWDMLELLQKHGISFLENETPTNFLIKSTHLIDKIGNLYKIDDIVDYFNKLIPLLKRSFPNQDIPFLSTIMRTLHEAKAMEILLKIDKNHFSQEGSPKKILQGLYSVESFVKQSKNLKKSNVQLAYNELIEAFLTHYIMPVAACSYQNRQTLKIIIDQCKNSHHCNSKYEGMISSINEILEKMGLDVTDGIEGPKEQLQNLFKVDYRPRIPEDGINRYQELLPYLDLKALAISDPDFNIFNELAQFSLEDFKVYINLLKLDPETFDRLLDSFIHKEDAPNSYYRVLLLQRELIYSGV